MPDGRILLASYHPSMQNTQTGKLTEKMFFEIFNKARHLCDGSKASVASEEVHRGKLAKASAKPQRRRAAAGWL
jgi:hypothetical protein